MIYFTLSSINGDKVVLKLNNSQMALIKARQIRSFCFCCKKEQILQAIDGAENCAALERLARKYDLCDACAFGDINFYGVKRILKTVVEVVYRYPKLRSKLCFIGTHNSLEGLLTKMEEGDTGILRTFNLQYICTVEASQKLGRLIRNVLMEQMARSDNYVAIAMCGFGLFDSVLLDKNDYDGYAYIELVSQLRHNEEIGFHPRGSHLPESVILHELGHLLDATCDFSESEAFKAYYESLSTDDIRNGLSEYALMDSKEFIAESFSEYMCAERPRSIALQVGLLLDACYQKTAAIC